MSHLADRLASVESRLTAAWSALRLEDSRARAVELEALMAEPGFWNDQNNARKLSQTAADLKKELELWEAFKRELGDLRDVVTLAEKENDSELKVELDRSLTELEAKFANMEFQMLLSGEFDTRSAILSLHAGAGGTDATDWVAMLLRMYTRFAETHGWQVEVLDESRGEEAGYKSVTIAIRGRFAYGWLRSEYGVHRLVRISPFDAEKMRHTTFALAEVIPEFDEVDEKALEIPVDDLRIDTFLASGKGGQSVNTTYSAVRITHIPTSISVSCQNERSQLQNRETALRVLKAKLFRLMVEARADKISDLKGEHKTAAWGNQIRSYVLHPYKLVKDHRTEVESVEVESILNGDLKLFMEAFLRQDVSTRQTNA
jgi:peptide chain release factor 2